VSVRDDRELDLPPSDLAKLERLYRDTAREEPPPAVDEAIRAAARRAVHARPSLARPALSSSWRLPLSIAAVLVLSVTLTLMLSDRGAHLPATREAAAPAPRAQPPATGRVGRPRPEPAVTPLPPRTPLSEPTSAVVPPKLAESTAQEVEQMTPPGAPAERNVPPVQQAAATAPRPSTARTLSSEDSAPQPSAQAEQTPASNLSRTTSGREAAEARTAAVNPEAETNAMPGAQVEPRLQAESRADESAGAPAQSKQRGALPPRASATAAGATALPSASPGAPWEASAEAWLKHVDELRGAGRLAEARESFAAFRLRYPEYRLPAGYVTP